PRPARIRGRGALSWDLLVASRESGTTPSAKAGRSVDPSAAWRTSWPTNGCDARARGRMARRSMTALRLALCAMLAACAGEEAEKPPPIGAGSGRSLAIHDAEVDEVGQVWLRFAVVHVGQTASLSVGLVNRSAEALDLGFVGPRAPFRFVDPPKRIGPGESVDVDVRFEPWEPGRFEADASIRSAGGGFALRLVGEARASPC